MIARDRVFLGVAIPDDIRHRLATQLEPLVRRRAIPGKRVPVDNWHITLRFVGAATELQQDSILAFLDEADLGGAITVSLTGLGAFPKPKKATVLWVGVGGGRESLATVAEIADTAAVAAGHAPEERPFHPHLTISRVRPPADVRELVEEVELDARFQVGEVTLFRSVTQGPQQPMRYDVVDTVEL